ncbi:MAG: NUDIX domain-containing protein [Candidatus Aminicenantes bacterium]|nr:MAG: NUDIX domain-containing protein [Candidatus Aminicenantes bacterium]
MTKHSAGILMYRFREDSLEVFLVHPGGPFWARKDEGAWSIPKGEFDVENEDPLEAAKREFEEETGFALEGDFISLDTLKQSSMKIVHAWAVEGDCDAAKIKSNTFSMEWPPRSGKQQEFPEVDRAGWFDVETAKIKLLKGQTAFIDKLLEKLEKA